MRSLLMLIASLPSRAAYSARYRVTNARAPPAPDGYTALVDRLDRPK
jgi:hypothetical protein